MIELNEEITYWTVSGNDGTGVTFNAGVKVPSRSASHTEMFMEENGKRVQTRYAVYTKVLIPEDSYIFLGDAEGELSPVAGSRVVVGTSEDKTMTTLRRMII